MPKTTDELDMSQALLGQKLDFITSELAEIKYKVSNHFVTKEEFEPYKKAFNLIASLVTVAVVSGILGFIFVVKK